MDSRATACPARRSREPGAADVVCHRLRYLAALPAVLIASFPAYAQSRARITGAIETGAAVLEQPLVRSGAAFYVAPSAGLHVRDLLVGADAVLATGTPIWQSFLGSGYVRSPALRNVRLTGNAQVLRTSGLINTWHGDVGAEWRLNSPTNTLQLRGRTGQLRFNGTNWRDADLAISATHMHGAMVLAMDAAFADARRPGSMQAQLGVGRTLDDTFDAQTLDIAPRMIWERGRIRTDASLALRAIQRGMHGDRVGAQLSLTFTTRAGLALFLGGVQRLPDLRAGIPAGKTALLGVRVSAARLVRASRTQPIAGPSLSVVNGRLVITVAGASASRAYLRGDFTDWQIRDCQPRGGSSFECGAAPPAGTWRVAVRLNDGNWQQPTNLAATRDDFGAVEGVLMTGGKP
jgi:hypothetical protein